VAFLVSPKKQLSDGGIVMLLLQIFFFPTQNSLGKLPCER
jgi:hypothetical protein